MKSKLLIMAVLCAIAFTANAQTKGTNALSFGVNSNTTTNSSTSNTSSSEYEYKNNSFTLGYGYFIKDNSKIGLELSYGLSKYDNDNSTFQENKNYGANISYQKYYPIVKTLFAYAGGRAGYTYGKQSSSSVNTSKSEFDSYTVGAYGGLTWFVSKRFAFETNLLSANASHSVQKQKNTSDQNINQSKSSNFNITTQGFINDLGFKIYILF